MVPLDLKHFHDFLVIQKIKIFFTINAKLQNNNFLKSIKFKFHQYNLSDKKN